MKSNSVFQQKYEELQLQMAMHLLSQKEIEDAEKEMESFKGDTAYLPTAEEEKQINALIDTALKQNRRHRHIKKVSRVLQKVAVFFLVLLVGLCITAVTVEAVRKPLINWLISLDEDSAEIHFQVENELPDFEFGYLPEGYKAILLFREGMSGQYSIENEEGNSLFLMIDPLSAGLSIDTENAKVSQLTINGGKAIGSEKEDVSILAWESDTYSFSLDGDIPLEELVKIAENMSW